MTPGLNETEAKILRELDEIRQELARRDEERNSVASRVWDWVAKVSQVSLMAIVGWVWGIGDRVTETETQLREIRATRFTAAAGLELEARMLARENPQLSLLVSEMRALALSMTDRLARLEAQVHQLQGR